MKQQRLDGLADGIFAIVMTLLAIELHVPTVASNSPLALWLELEKTWPILISLVLSFALLFTYWRAHHYIASVYAKNVTVPFANINAFFFLTIVFVPFTAHLLGQYNDNVVAIAVYGLNVILIGLVLFWMRKHAEHNPHIETTPITKADHRSGYIRILFPVFAAICAIILSFWNTTVSIVLFTIAILFNLLPASSNIIHRWLDLWFSDEEDMIETNYLGSMDIDSRVHDLARDLRQMPPRSPYEKIAGFAILARAIDTCRAHLVHKLGAYKFNGPLDQKLFTFKDIDPDDFEKAVARGLDDEEMGEWMLCHGTDKHKREITMWSKSFEGRFDSVEKDDEEAFTQRQ
jgi:uncharacterized membrane protein